LKPPPPNDAKVGALKSGKGQAVLLTWEVDGGKYSGRVAPGCADLHAAAFLHVVESSDADEIDRNNSIIHAGSTTALDPFRFA
jgi:hypothetical protein